MKKFICKYYKLLIASVLIIALIEYGLGAYTKNYYHAGNTSAEALLSDDIVTVDKVSDRHEKTVTFAPKNPTKGLIFYPGAKVEYTAYAPLLHEFARNGYVCMVIHMPYNLAILDKNAADKYIDSLKDKYTTVKNWYVGGHSLGGAMAASYAAKNTDKIDGLFLFAAYSTSDLSDSGLSVYSVYGSNDKVLNMKKYNKYKKNLPDDVHEFVIDGGCHSYFGNYGLQKGDGDPDITMDEQIQATIDFIESENAG